MAQILAVIGSQRTRQLSKLIANGASGTWKLMLIGTMQNVEVEVVERCLKGLLGLHYGREAAMTLRTLLPLFKNTELNQFSQSLIVSSCLKFFRQEGDSYLRKLSLCVLTEIYGNVNLPVNG